MHIFYQTGVNQSNGCDIRDGTCSGTHCNLFYVTAAVCCLAGTGIHIPVSPYA